MTRLSIPSTRIEAREAVNGRPRTIAGTAIVYGVVGHFPFMKAAVAPGAFDSSIAEKSSSPERDVLALIAHDSSRVLGRTSNGTFRLIANKDSLEYEIDINNDDPEAVSAWQKVKRGDYTASSVGFSVVDGEFQDMVDNGLDRVEGEAEPEEVLYVAAGELYEVSVLAHGAFGGADSKIAAEALREKYASKLEAGCEYCENDREEDEEEGEESSEEQEPAIDPGEPEGRDAEVPYEDDTSESCSEDSPTLDEVMGEIVNKGILAQGDLSCLIQS